MCNVSSKTLDQVFYRKKTSLFFCMRSPKIKIFLFFSVEKSYEVLVFLLEIAEDDKDPYVR